MSLLQAPSQTAPASRRGHVVLLVEDDAGLRGALERVLRASGFVAQSYASAESVLADCAMKRPECLVVDLNLPAMSGLDLVDRLRQLGMTAPAVLITANDQPQVRNEVRRRGVEHFLAKPFGGSALVAMLKAILAGQRPDGHSRGTLN